MNSVNKLIFVGGCHVQGHIVGYDNSFSNILSRDLFCGYECHVSGPTSVRNTMKYLSSFEDIGPNDVIFIQLGNFETGASVFPGNSGKGESLGRGSIRRESTLDKFSISRTFSARFFGILKLVFVAYYDLIGLPKFDSRKFGADVSVLFEFISKIPTTNVYVLSPFYSIQPHLNLYRSRASIALNDACSRIGAHYIDVTSVFCRNAGFLGLKNFAMADPEHLNIFGHIIIADEIKKFFREFQGGLKDVHLQPPPGIDNSTYLSSPDCS